MREPIWSSLWWQMIGIHCILVGDIHFFFFLNKLQDLCIHFQVITTAQLYILFKIVGFIILVIFVAFWLLSFNWSVHIEHFQYTPYPPTKPIVDKWYWFEQMIFTQTCTGYPLRSSKEKHHSFFILAPSSYLNPPAYESVYYTYTPCKSSNSLMSNPKNNFGFISRVNSISFANTFGIWTRDKLVYFSPCQYWYGKYKCIV